MMLQHVSGDAIWSAAYLMADRFSTWTKSAFVGLMVAVQTSEFEYVNHVLRFRAVSRSGLTPPPPPPSPHRDLATDFDVTSGNLTCKKDMFCHEN